MTFTATSNFTSNSDSLSIVYSFQLHLFEPHPEISKYRDPYPSNLTENDSSSQDLTSRAKTVHDPNRILPITQHMNQRLATISSFGTITDVKLITIPE